MEWIEQGLLALVIGLPAVLGLMLVLTASRLTRLHLRRSALRIVAKEAIPDPVRLTLDKAKPLLDELGFQYRYSTACERSVATDGDSMLFTDVYQHVDGHTHALASPSMTPEQGQPCTVMWVTLFQSGKALATVNCYRHNLVSAPAGWVIHDDYLPDVRKVWQRHRSRLAAAKQTVVQDGVEFFWATKQATDQLMSHCEKKGLLVRRDDHWQMPWRVALPYAWKLFRGQRKVARLRSRSSPGQSGPASQHGVRADVEAFEQQLAVQRATRWSSKRKFKVFLLTAALFLGVGSLWISWTFLPILLAVIGLHEGGHYLAMKISGYRNLSIFFVPGLGGLATGEKASASPWEKLFVYLAGPMPGIALAVAGLIGQLTGIFQPPAWFQEFLFACLIINYLNLLPITPLDGGRVVETFLFARLPVARFLFAVLGLAAFCAFGLSTGDTVMLVIAVLVGLSLPHQWRVMRVDRAIARQGSEILDERGAIEQVFTALQHPRFAGWPFLTRAAAATALLPELQGRRAGAVEAVVGLTIYLACLLAPPVAAVLAVPQLGDMAAAFGYSIVADDVDPEPGAPQPPQPPRDWYAEAAQVQLLPEGQRLSVLLGAADFASESRDEEKSQAFLDAAWSIAQRRPTQDYERARTLMAMARDHKDAALRRQWLKQVATELEGLRDKPTLLLLAEAKQGLAWDDITGGAERVELMRAVVAHRQEALAEGEYDLVNARVSLAHALDAQNAPGEVEAVLRQNIAGIPVPASTDRSRAALDRRTQRILAQVELAWFLIAQGRAKDAGMGLQTAMAAVPAKITMSWEHPNRQLREAYLWANLQQVNVQAVKTSWQQYEESRSGIAPRKAPPIMHEIDRLIVAQSTADESMSARALAAIAESLKSSQDKFVHSRLCAQLDHSPPWRLKQQQARRQAAKTAGLCGTS